MDAHCFPRRAISTVAATVLMLCASAAQATACTTQEEAIDQYKSLMQAAAQKIQSANEPDTLRKDKIGWVLVARAAASTATDQDAQRRDIAALGQQFARAPADICRAVDSIRQTHGL